MEEIDLSTRKKWAIGIAAVVIVLLPILLLWLIGKAGLRVASIITAGLLSLALVVLYDQQRSIQKRQVKLRERDFESNITWREKPTVNGDEIFIELKNEGRGTANSIKLRSEIITETGSVEIDPGFSRLVSTENESGTLHGPSRFKQFTGDIRLSTQVHSNLPFRLVSEDLIEEEVPTCTVRMSLEVADESTASTDDNPIPIAEQEVKLAQIDYSEVSENPECHLPELPEGRTRKRITFSNAFKAAVMVDLIDDISSQDVVLSEDVKSRESLVDQSEMGRNRS